MKKIKTKQLGAIIMLVFAGMIWGGSFVVVKDSLDYITPLWQLALRLGVAVIPSVVLAIINIRKWNFRIIKKGIILGLIFSAALISQNKGMQYVSASKSAFLTGTYVAFLPLFEMLFLRKKIQPRRIAAALICTAGAALLTIQGRFVPEWGDLSLLLCGAMYAVHLIYIDENMDINPVLLHIGQIVTAAVICMVVAFIFEPVPQKVSVRCVPGLLYCGILEVFVGFFFQLIGQKNASTSISAILLSMEAVYGALFSAIFLGDKMNVKMAVGSALIVASAIVNGLGGNDRGECSAKTVRKNDSSGK
ncbi:MAG: DMT family transporter [Butyrivibrio sp.]